MPESENPTVRELIERALANKDDIMANDTFAEIVIIELEIADYDGLYADVDGDGCGCSIEDDLFPCGLLQMNCRAGYIRQLDGPDCDFIICSTKSEAGSDDGEEGA